MRLSITAVILAKDEEQMIGDAIRSVAFADKILVVNNDSSDNTENISKKLGAQVIRVNSQDFSELRSYPLKKITTDYIFYLDADERVSESLEKEIITILESGQGAAAYRIPRQNFYFGLHPWPKIEHLERLFKANSLKGWRGILHETADVKGSISDLKSPILHYSHQSLASMVEKTNRWSEAEARLRLASKHPKMSWWRFPRVMMTAFNDSYFRQEGYKAGTAGVVESIYQAFSIFITYAKLWELQEEEKAK